MCSYPAERRGIEGRWGREKERGRRRREKRERSGAKLMRIEEERAEKERDINKERERGDMKRDGRKERMGERERERHELQRDITIAVLHKNGGETHRAKGIRDGGKKEIKECLQRKKWRERERAKELGRDKKKATHEKTRQMK